MWAEDGFSAHIVRSGRYVSWTLRRFMPRIVLDSRVNDSATLQD